jgi:GDP-4-dehydro-6-deoxy-D-mannose reductase
VKVLVTGGDGFAGAWLIRALLAAGHEVAASHRAGGAPAPLLTRDEAARVAWQPLELASAESVTRFCGRPAEAVVHLAALASGSDARRDPGLAWAVNAAGTARLAEALGQRLARGEGDPLLLLVSTAEVYGAGRGVPRTEADPLLPVSPYASSKVGAEVAAAEVARRTGLRVVVARPFPHTGPGQDARFAVAALAERLRAARKAGTHAIRTGNLEVVRDLLDVRDVAAAYLALLTRGAAGQAYDVASGTGRSLAEVLERLQRIAGWPVTAEPDPGLLRQGDILHLVGVGAPLRQATGWLPRYPFDRTLQDLFDAQAD